MTRKSLRPQEPETEARSLLEAGQALYKLRASATHWAHIWGIPHLLSEVTVRANPRLRVSVARYVRRTRTVEIGQMFPRLRKHRRDVLLHELAHAAVDVLGFRESSAHGPVWRSLIDRAGGKPKARLALRNSGGLRRPSNRPRVGRRMYVHRCPVCHLSRIGFRPVSQWRCAPCSAAGLEGVLLIETRGAAT